MPAPRFLNPYEEITRHKNHLPHWQQPGSTYFVTFRLADSVPHELLARWQRENAAWFTTHPKPWSRETERAYDQRFTRRMEGWLDLGSGKCWLRDASIREPLETSLHHGDGQRYVLHAWVIMPNHVHLLFSLNEGLSVGTEIGAWKGISARLINALLERQGELWQEDYFDRIVRNQRHFTSCAAYIRDNPGKAGLRTGEFAVYESEYVREILEGVQ